MVNYSAIETGSELGGFAHDPTLLFAIVAVIIFLGLIIGIIYTLLGK